MTPPIGVLLFNLGGPDDLASVEPFLVNLFSDRDIIELPLGAVTQPIFARLIAKLRGPSVRRNYALIGGGSPQLPITRAQAAALEARLNAGPAEPAIGGPALSAGAAPGEAGGSSNPGFAGTFRRDAAGPPEPALAGTQPRDTAGLSGPRFAGTQPRDAAGLSGPGFAGTQPRDAAGSSEPDFAGTRATPAARAQTAIDRVEGPRFRVFIAMRYWRPSTEDALAQMRAAGVRRVVTLTLFPHWSKATTGSSQKELERVLGLPKWRGAGFVLSGVDRYADDPVYLDAFADTVRRAYSGFSPPARERAVVLFSAHGLPQKFIDAGDPYVGQIEATRRGLLDRLKIPNRQLLGYQSRTGPVKWIGPGTDERLEELGREGVKEVLIVPLSFVSDHIETLYEVDILFADMARKAGITEYRRPEALNTHPLFIECLARLVERHLGELG